ncbi:MAG: ABC transporter ATP-binding protein [Firmicutes bacterium]|nr:ABC transporter ATP-binding protein [Bacillota bacterium]
MNVLELKGITKRFPGVLANDHVSFELAEGEVHAILGENGAGKSTLMNVLYGLYEPDEGEIVLNGTPVRLSGPRDAIAHGIGMVHQHFMLIGAMTVTENIILGDEPTPVWYHRREAEERIRSLSEQYHLGVDPHARIESLPVGLQQRVEILKAFYRQAHILILDEPTAALTPQESEELFSIIRHLTQQGISVIFISHKLDEVLQIADRVTVMRRGVAEATLSARDATPQQLANLMVGRDVVLRVEKPPQEAGEVLLSVRHLQVAGRDGVERVHDVSFNVRAGEIFGIAGVEGNGQFELAEALAGVLPVSGGQLLLAGKAITSMSALERARAGIGYIPEDRSTEGLISDFSITDNFLLKEWQNPRFFGPLGLRRSVAEAYALEEMEAFDVRPRDPRLPAGHLSGGNQQKVILAREVSRSPQLLIAAQPTRGLDVGAIEFVHQQLLRLREAGRAVLLISLELDEILTLSDRIGVLYGGRLVAVVPGETATREQLGGYMTGATPAQEEGVVP